MQLSSDSTACLGTCTCFDVGVDSQQLASYGLGVWISFYEGEIETRNYIAVQEPCQQVDNSPLVVEGWIGVIRKFSYRTNPFSLEILYIVRP